jgi:lipopolysaccharide/colanic/teichoic acid biosynthesis glycosyltransferase
MSRRVARALVYLGIAATVLGLSKVHAAYIADPAYSFTGSFRFAWAIAYIVLLAITAYGAGLPDLPRSTRQGMHSSVAAAGGGAIAISLVQLMIGDALLPRFVVFGSALLLLPWFLACVAMAADGSSGSARHDRILVVSDAASTSVLRQELSRGAESAARVTAVVSIASAEPTGDGLQPLVERARHDRISVLVLDREAQNLPSVVAQAATLHQGGVRVRTLSMFYEEWLGKFPVAELERVSLLFDIGDLHRSRYVRLKRVGDIVLALAGLVVFVAVIPVVAIVNLVANRGRVFYTQPRVGKGGREFPIIKFRTMAGAATDGQPSEWTREDDPRITPFGRFLRITHIDELPQVVNILRGELSVVGPRPEQPNYVAELTDKLPFYDLRHLARPGLTGWAQVKYGYAGDESDALEKLQYEFYYLRHQSLALDLRIVGRTIRSVVGRGGR